MSKSPTEAYESYLNGNITDFKAWLKRTTKANVVHVTYLWLKDGNDMLKLKSYAGAS